MKKVCGYIVIKKLFNYLPTGLYKPDYKIMFRGTCNEVVNQLFDSRKEAVKWLEINEPRWIIG